MGLLSRGESMLTRQMKNAGGESITYTRSAYSVTLTAWVGRTVFTGLDRSGPSRIEWGDRDYLVSVEDLVLNGSEVKPQRGDRITATVNGSSVTFEVLAPEGEPAWRYAFHQDRSVYRVHCKRVS